MLVCVVAFYFYFSIFVEIDLCFLFLTRFYARASQRVVLIHSYSDQRLCMFGFSTST